jgi:hypothetical protein
MGAAAYAGIVNIPLATVAAAPPSATRSHSRRVTIVQFSAP